LFCKIFFIPNNNDRNTLFSILEGLSNSTQIITTNSQINQEFQNQGKNCQFLSEIFPAAEEKTYEIHRTSRKILENYRGQFKKVQFHEIEIFSSIENQILQEIILIEKARGILNKNKDTIFIFDTFSYANFAILELSRELGYSQSEAKIFKISEKSINEINPNDIIRFLDYNKKYQFFQKISHTQPNDQKMNKKLLNEKLEEKYIDSTDSEIIEENDSQQRFRFFLEVFPIILQSNLLKIADKFHFKIQNYLVKKIEKKLYNVTEKNEAKCAFFITTKRDDLFKPLLRVMDEFKNKKTLFQIFTFDFASKKILSRRKTDFIDFFEESYLLAGFFGKSKEGISIKQQIENISLNNTIPLLSIKQFRNYLVEEIFRIIAIMIICEHLFKKTSLESIVVGFGVTRNGNAVIATAKKFGIQSFTILTQLLALDPLLSNLYKSDKLCVYGKAGLEQLLTLGYRKENIFLTGNPRYDDLKKLDVKTNKEYLEQNFQIEKNKKLLVIAMSRWHINDEIWMSNLIKFCNKNNIEIVIKVHPVYKLTMEDIHKDKIKKISNSCTNQKFIFTFDINLTTLLSAADVVITDFSNAGVEAILLEKPLITVNFANEDFSNVHRFHEYNASIYVDEYEQIEKIIMEILMDKKHIQELKKDSKKVIDMYNYYNDGNAANRIFNILHNPNKETP